MQKCQLQLCRAKASIERGVNATDHRCEWRLPMAMWGRMPLPPMIPICPQEPWEAQEEAHRDRIRVKLSFCVEFCRAWRGWLHAWPGNDSSLRTAGSQPASPSRSNELTVVSYL